MSSPSKLLSHGTAARSVTEGEPSIDPKRERPSGRAKARPAAAEQQVSAGRDKAEVERWAAEQRELTASMIAGPSGVVGVPQVIAAAHFQADAANALSMAAALPTALLAPATQYYCMPCVYGDRTGAAPLQLPMPALSIAPYALSPAAPAGMVASFYAGTDRPTGSVSHYDPYYTTYVAQQLPTEQMALALQQVSLVPQAQAQAPPPPGSSQAPRRLPRRVSQSAADQQNEAAAAGRNGDTQPHRLDRFVSQPAGSLAVQVPLSRAGGGTHSRSRSRDREGVGLEAATLVNLSQSARAPVPRPAAFRSALHSVSGVESRVGVPSLRALPLESASAVDSAAPLAPVAPPHAGGTATLDRAHQREQFTDTVDAIARLASAAAGDTKHYGDNFTVV